MVILLEDWLVIVESVDEIYFIILDLNGFYFVLVDIGIYIIKILFFNNLWDVCELEINIVVFNEFYDMMEINFDVIGGVDCFVMQVDVIILYLVSCQNVIYLVFYCNLGFVIGEDVFIMIVLDEELIFFFFMIILSV